MNGEQWEELHKFEATFENETYMTGLGANEETWKQYLLKVLDYYLVCNQDIKETISAKEQLKNNELKIKLLETMLSSGNSVEECWKQVEDKAVKPELSLSKTEAEECSESLKKQESQKVKQDLDLKNIQTRNEMLAREVKKAKDLPSEAKKLDSRASDLTEEIKNLEEELKLLGDL